MAPQNGVDDFKPKGFFLCKFHYKRLETENQNSGLGDARNIRWAVNGLLGGIAVAVMPFLDWPADASLPLIDWSPSLKGLAFSTAGVGLAGFSLFMMIRRARIKEADDNERYVGRDGDRAP